MSYIFGPSDHYLDSPIVLRQHGQKQHEGMFHADGVTIWRGVSRMK